MNIKPLLAISIVALLMAQACKKDEPIMEGEETSSAFDENGASYALFSVSPTKQVRFSRGNLQYLASQNIWRFAEHQYDCILEGNINISNSNDSWIDLFGWGTSGWNSGAVCYHPWDTSGRTSDYYPGGNYNNNLIGNYANADWAFYNSIANGGKQTRMWRIMTAEEWDYLLGARDSSNTKKGRAVIDGRYRGFVLLPDNWKLPSGLSFKYRYGSSSWSSANLYTLEEWEKMERAGAIFLPAAGLRQGKRMFSSSDYGVDDFGSYWTSSYASESDAKRVSFSLRYTTNSCSWLYRWGGCSVRPVKDK